ncbi:hypothetical protein CHS0354_014664 [Potamilus streckersoni]|uniref:Crossover junction endonuclease MUS81 n=1 Tax=Potamilus streckersoni TaxID=2493646 RepID=A0AAE0SPV3_9BIVA|nr:hypothetical protein CHS0354_014664 [Potamilus streckersoni]
MDRERLIDNDTKLYRIPNAGELQTSFGFAYISDIIDENNSRMYFTSRLVTEMKNTGYEILDTWMQKNNIEIPDKDNIDEFLKTSIGERIKQARINNDEEINYKELPQYYEYDPHENLEPFHAKKSFLNNMFQCDVGSVQIIIFCGDLSIINDILVKVYKSLYYRCTLSPRVVMLVDTSEWGGDRASLSLLCELLNQTEIRYKTKRLLTGDYSWLWRYNGKERILPLLVEIKRADDVARTLKDGRFWSRVNKMVVWKKEFLKLGVPCQLQYLLEGQPEQYVVRCADGCKGVGHCGNPTLIQVKVLRIQYTSITKLI